MLNCTTKMDNQASEGWTREQTLCLIKELKKFPCLYNPVDINFVNKVKRSEKFNLIYEQLKVIKPSLKISEIKRKIKSLKGQLWKETQKLTNSKRSGSGTNEIYHPKLWCYNELSFLLYVNDSEPSKSNINLSDIGIDDSREELPQSDIASPQKASEKNKSKSNPLEAYGMGAIEFMKNYFTSRPAKQPLQKEEEFCRYLCSLLKNIKSEETYENLTLEIIVLVNKTTMEERKQLQKENYFSPINNSQSYTFPRLSSTPHSLTSTSSSRNCTATSSPLPHNPQILRTTSSSSNCSNTPSPIIHPPLDSFPYPQNIDELTHLESRHQSSTSTSNISFPATSSPLPHNSVNLFPQSQNIVPVYKVQLQPFNSTTSSRNPSNTHHQHHLTDSFFEIFPRNTNEPQNDKPKILENILLVPPKREIKNKNLLQLAMDNIFEDIIIEDSQIIL